MGQTGSVPVSRRKSFKKSFSSPFTRRSTGQGSLSATFNYNDSHMKVNQLNLNLATEEELMTLPGVSRTIARNIIEYRQAIGRFNKVEDVALVSGVGADRLEQIRPEICVTRKKAQSCGGSLAQSCDSLSSSELSPQGSRPPLDVNKATVFQLMAIRGVNQELAAAIVEYRDRRGDFFTLDDLLKVKGMTQIRLSTLRSRLSVKPDLRLSGAITFPEHRRLLNGKLPPNELNLTATSGVLARDVYELVSAYCPRPVSSPPPVPPDSFRLASWNLTDLSRDKATNPAVRELFCLTLLENRISLVAVQGVQEACALQMLCNELKYPLCRRVRDWKGDKGDWKADFVPIKRANGLKSLGFLYNTEVVNVRGAKAVQDNSLIRAAIATLLVEGRRVEMLNVELGQDCASSGLHTVVSSVQPHFILGDFTSVTSSDGCSMPGYQTVLSQPENTRYDKETKSLFSDNIFIREVDAQAFSGVSGVVRSGLSHLAIPRGWNWNGPVSEHCPVWAQFSLRSLPLPLSGL